MNEQQKASAADLRRLWRAFKFSMAGIRATFRHEAAFRQELVAALVMIPIAVFLTIPLTAKALLIAAVLLVLITELFNSAIEAVVDLVSPEYHSLAGRAKDIGSAAVLVSLVSCVTIWCLVLVDHFY